ncbi:radical SAM protein [bacterium]|nr:MAG: radical SAM protein [bacterium]
MSVISRFDPWKGKLCTCPPKYSVQPYTGCSHACVYCYTVAYVPDYKRGRPKKNFLRQFEREIKKADLSLPLSFSNSSDPYQPLEKELMLTRRALEITGKNKGKAIVVTKSPLVLRDVDIIGRYGFTVSLTITTLREEISSFIEPGAPPPQERLNALRILAQEGIPVSVRIDPLIPGINLREFEKILDAVAPYASHIIVSTLKLYRGSEIKKHIDLSLYSGNYMKEEIRREIIEMAQEKTEERGLTFSSCREGFPELNTGPTCDGTHLIVNYI